MQTCSHTFEHLQTNSDILTHTKQAYKESQRKGQKKQTEVAGEEIHAWIDRSIDR